MSPSATAHGAEQGVKALRISSDKDGTPKRMSLFSRTITTRGYEPDRYATVPVQRYLNYLEWLRWEFIQEPSTGLLEGLQSGHFPVVRSQRFELVQRVGMGRDLKLWAKVTKVGRSTVTLEHHVIASDDGTLVAHAIVEGLWLGPSRRLVRIPDAFRRLAEQHTSLDVPGFSVPEPNRPMDDGVLIHTRPKPCIFKREGLALNLGKVPTTTFRNERIIRPSDIDIFSHVNAATYVDMFEDTLYEAFRTRSPIEDWHHRPGPVNRLMIQYDRESLLDERVMILCWKDGDDGFSFELRRASDDVVLCRAILAPQD